MINRYLWILGLILLLAGCLAKSANEASEKYLLDKDYGSLETIYKSFEKGSSRKEVEHLLGEPDYSPLEGQYYYSSNRSIYSEEQERQVIVGLVVDYRDENGVITENLQNFWLGPIGE